MTGITLEYVRFVIHEWDLIMKIKARKLKRAQTFIFRGLKFEVIVCISDEDSCVVSVVCYDSMRNTMVVQLHKNFEIEATGEPKEVLVISMSDEELEALND